MSWKKILFLLNALTIIIGAQAQGNDIPIGTWRVHLPYQIIHSVEATPDRIFAAADINGYYFRFSDNSLNILSRINGLNDIGINKVKYHAGLNMLILGYENGNIDIIQNDVIINVNDIERKNIVGSKKINDISFFGNFAFLSCDFGLSVLNLERLEVKETYSNLAPGGMPNKVYASTFSSDADSLFLATEKGIMVGKYAPNINLMDFTNWFTYGAGQNIPTTNVASVTNFNNKIYAAVNNNGLYYLNGNSWTNSAIPLDNNFQSFKVSANKLLICSGQRVLVATNENSYTYIDDILFDNPSEAVYDKDGHIWIGDLVRGLISDINGSLNYYKPNAPLSKEAFRLAYHDNNIIVMTGGYGISYNFIGRNAEYYVFDNYNWNSYNIYTPGMPFCRDIINGTYNSKDGKRYFASYGYGVLAVDQNSNYELIDDTIAGFKRALDAFGPYVFISDVKADKDGHLWVSSGLVPSLTDKSLYVRKNGVWSGKSFNRIEAQYILEITIDDNNYKWLRLRPETGGGLIVYDDKTNNFKYLNDQDGTGGLPDNKVRAIAKDLNGDMWVGTDEGIAIFYKTKNIFSGSVNAVSPIYDGFPLLYNEEITCIEVDGGNRKWVGTKNGLWLLNDDGTEALTYFTAENSPLLSNYIMDVEINEKTGEVFIATDKGVISYRGTATSSNTTQDDNVKVFPNPIPRGFTGMVGISGLTTDADVKITDIYGNLIYQTKAEGGTAVWNGKDYNGTRAEPGVYLIFSSSEDGTQTYVSKIAVTE